jgi:flagellar motor switch protein FliG
MAALDEQERVAILLHLLGERAAQSIIGRLTGQYANVIGGRLAELAENPPLSHEIDEVLDDFERSLELAAAPPGSLLRAYRPEDEEQGDETAGSEVASSETREPTPAFEMTDDPLADLRRLTPYQIAGALSQENSQTAALVLSCLPAEAAAETLRLMPDSLRSSTFMRLGQAASTPALLVHRIVKTTVARAATIEENPEDKQQGDQKMVEMLRAMSKKNRSQLLDIISEEEPELAERLLVQLFVFEDILRIESRSLQKLLMEIETETLLTALQEAETRLVDKIMGNLPKRTREALTEEMRYMVPATEEVIEAARASITRQMMELDRAGQLVFES